MNNPRIFLRSSWMMAITLILLAGGISARGQSSEPPAIPLLKNIGIDQHLKAQVPLDLVFRDENGKSVKLGELRRGRPIILVLIQLGCPSLCTTILNDTLSTMKVIPQSIGDEYDVWTISFDPKETPALAAEKRGGYLRTYERTRPGAKNAAAGWRFLTGPPESIAALTGTVGYRYRWDEATGQFVHPAGLILLTPEGKISRYFFGIDYDPTDLRLSLVEASQGRIGSVTDKILLYCYHYDPATGRYGLAIANVLRAGAAFTLVALAGGLAMLWRADRRRTRRLLTRVHEGVPSPLPHVRGGDA
ncbi:MAG TPA: SCO family protein [Phycisphaerae bacterium]|jgi:protein SCO1/2